MAEKLMVNLELRKKNNNDKMLIKNVTISYSAISKS